MATIRSYRLISLALLIGGVLSLFLGFFFLWVVAPAIVIGAFYLVFVFVEERRALKNGEGTRRTLRRKLLTDEAQARDRDLDRRMSA